MSFKKPLVFISHIHEEGALAKLLKDAIEAEFGGFVEVFVSSDHQGIAQGTGIAAGAHFVEAVETGLVHCVAALYLISPRSISRPWVNFELGAVWCRGAVQKSNGGNRIMALPVCHSEASRSSLPAPLNALNAINGNSRDDLEFAFKSLQRELGVAGNALRTNFDYLAQQVVEFEQRNTVGEALKRVIWALGEGDRQRVVHLVESCRQEAQRGTQSLTVDAKGTLQSSVDKVLPDLNKILKGKMTLTIVSSGTAFGTNGTHNYCDIRLVFDPSLVVNHADTILS
ncbi:toll/interleukin-1 receptor domain-containing protein [Burkholderia multivorans]|uniref:toll/interleukin-1 receptor domain-containing protein n=1 Tax=Burkholderia multivorans TaxID=87883 RepID=UPI001C269EED|nr:toll/interleukin-1 receptor domain-containing protein [Burkholderia multivorans]MBU9552618.1 toll/interleukin-1 receptor domain-containing protein [Burkholderia multivorans]